MFQKQEKLRVKSVNIFETKTLSDKLRKISVNELTLKKEKYIEIFEKNYLTCKISL